MKLAISTSLCALIALGSTALAQQAPPPPVAGKVVAVSHEKVTVNNTQVLDKITVTVDSCDARGTLKTVHYAPATVSDRAALGHLFNADYHSAMTPNMEKQQMPNGFGIFWVDANSRVLRTGILGNAIDCSKIPALVQQFK